MLPGGGAMYVPRAFVAAVNARDRQPHYVWRGEAGAGSIAVELISYHRARQLDAVWLRAFMQERVERKRGVLIGEVELLILDGCETLYGNSGPAPHDDATEGPYGAYARILTRTGGLLIEVEHPDRDAADQLARAVLATLVF